MVVYKFFGGNHYVSRAVLLSQCIKLYGKKLVSTTRTPENHIDNFIIYIHNYIWIQRSFQATVFLAEHASGNFTHEKSTIAKLILDNLAWWKQEFFIILDMFRLLQFIVFGDVGKTCIGIV